jgi:glyoxylase-like metal-dependent hydrolase (beta-lactamase superfamily II)
MLKTNCYLVWNDAGQAYVIDPSGEAEVILAAIDERQLDVKAILLTHAHVDHISALPQVSSAFDVPVYLHNSDLGLYRSPHNCFPPWLPAVQGLPATVDELDIEIDGLAYGTLETPGHTPGGVSFYFADSATVFAGDTLFQRSIGRTDLPGGDMPTLAASIRNVLYTLPGATTVFPGHGPATAIGEERAANPFVRE